MRKGSHNVMTPNEGKSRPCCRGLSLEELAPGTFRHRLRSKRVPDRSLVEAIWVVIAVNEAHAVLKFHCGGPVPHDPASATRIVPLQEYEFYRAQRSTPPVTSSSPQPWSASGIAETGSPLSALKPRAEDRACVTPRPVTNSAKSSVQGEK